MSIFGRVICWVCVLFFGWFLCLLFTSFQHMIFAFGNFVVHGRICGLAHDDQLQP
jgi:hypothetical protein